MVKEDFFWFGGRVWLDLVNTEAMVEGTRTDLLAAPGAAHAWIRAALEQTGNGELPANLRESELREGLQELRGLLRELCSDYHQEGVIRPEFAARLNTWLAPPAPGLRLVPQAEGWGLQDEIAPHEVLQWIFPIARVAAQSIACGELKLLRPCGNPDCILWFLDTSKNHTRRWCSMEACGNRHKVKEHYRRKRHL